ncbi:hypothetical protein NC652_005123 [Populus alba x Populus x berolinensis]|nr:hypothetical protein NC652_005123 [Populus alba x Populus x berolinensis]
MYKSSICLYHLMSLFLFRDGIATLSQHPPTQN